MRTVLIAATGVALVAAAVTGAVLALFTPYVFDLLGFHPVALDYMDGRISRPEIVQMVIDGQTFGVAEIDHLDDVAAMLDRLTWVFIASAAGFVGAVIGAPRLAHTGSLFALAGLAVVGIAVVAAYFLLGFETVGTVFHEILFPQGNWRFPWYFLIIRLYGTSEMLRGAGFVIVTGLGAIFASVAVTSVLARRTRRATQSA